MDKMFYVKAALIALVTLLAAWLLVPTIYYFKLPADERNQPEKLESVLPAWAPPAKIRLNLGLDLQGGISLGLGVDTDTALRGKTTRRADELKAFAEEKGIEGITTSPDLSGKRHAVVVKAETPAALDQAKKVLLDYYQDMNLDDSDATSFRVSFDEREIQDARTKAVDQALKVITNRVDRWGVTEPIITKRGKDEIQVQLPGFKDPARAKDLLGKTAQLEFKIADDKGTYFADLFQRLLGAPPEGVKVETESEAGKTNQVLVLRTSRVSLGMEPTTGGLSPYLIAMGEQGADALAELVALSGMPLPEGREMGIECIPSKYKKNSCEGYRSYLLNAKAELMGDAIVDARALLDQGQGGGGRPYVALNFDANGAHVFERVTGENVGNRMAIVLDGTVNSAPVIQARIGGGRAQITLGSNKNYQELIQEANDLALVLKAGALPAPVTISEERTVGASLGPELIQRGGFAVAFGVLLVVLFVAIYYRVSGVIVNIALLLNALIVLAAMAAFNATLTLPGIAGFVLTLGMAVDSNVLINERIREELRLGKTLRTAIEAGYDRVFWTIFDSNLTTLFAGFVLLSYGSGPVRGFAVMLIVGILASMFTALVVTRLVFEWLVVGRGWKSISL
ncbi:MAG: protein translocase subunit SecD [Myxococcales bacterium]|jgi:preprotein translocase subunit SecD|nr:protein translocase subunit SecD [Myxococcales bacterium]